MALYRGSALTTSVSGTVGGLTFVQGAHSNIVRATPAPLPARAPLQMQRQVAMALVSAAWRDLTAAQQAAWTAEGAARTATNRIGTKSPLSGYQLFRRFNTIHLLVNGSIESLPIAKQPDEQIQNPSLNFASGTTVEIGFDNPTTYIARILVYGALHFRSTRTAKLGPFAYLGLATGPFAGPIDITALWTTRFQLPTAGQFYAAKIFMWDSVQIVSAPFFLSDLA